MATLSRSVDVRPAPTRGPAAIRAVGFELVRRGLRDARTRTLAFAYLFAFVAYLDTTAYRAAYKTAASRLTFAHGLGSNKAIDLFYGKAYDLLTIGGYTGWRVGGTLAIFAAIFGLFAGVRALRAEEDAGRVELVLAGAVSRRTRHLAAVAVLVVSTAVLWLAEFAGLCVAGLPAGPSAYLALSTASVVFVFAGVAALVSQIAASRRVALELGGGAVALGLLARILADTVNGAGWLRWLTPLGWAEQMRPFTGAEPAVLVAPLLTGVALLTLAGRIARRRDIGTGLLAGRDSAPPRLALLSSATAQALRCERSSLTVWLLGTAAFAGICGAIAKATQTAGLSKHLQHQFAKLGSGSIVSAKGYLGLTFTFFVLLIAMFAIAQVSAARHEESDGRLETLLSLPLGRARWLGGRLAIGACAAAAIAFAAALAAWAGALASGASVPLGGMLEAGMNCIVMAVLFGGLTALLFAIVPSAAGGVAYGIATVAFLWQLIGSLLSVPHWLLEVTPFAHIGLAPGAGFRLEPALAMTGIGVLCAVLGVLLFRGRDIAGA